MHSFEKKLNVWYVQDQLQDRLLEQMYQKQLDLRLKALRMQFDPELSSRRASGIARARSQERRASTESCQIEGSRRPGSVGEEYGKPRKRSNKCSIL
jgi:hypothetical protein